MSKGSEKREKIFFFDKEIEGLFDKESVREIFRSSS
jgi:hypothetical protein